MSMTPTYRYLNEQDHKFSDIPPRLVNGGRDTGPAATGPWGSIPVLPDYTALSQNLGKCVPAPPPYAQQQPTTFHRPGNNQVAKPYTHHVPFPLDKSKFYDITCIEPQNV